MPWPITRITALRPDQALVPRRYRFLRFPCAAALSPTAVRPDSPYEFRDGSAPWIQG